jgi:hypothetical protein
MNYALRANVDNTGHRLQAIIDYAIHPGTKELRLAATHRYADPSDLPAGNNTMVHNTPLLVAVATISLPYAGQVDVVMDEGLMIVRRPREMEVQALTRMLLSDAVKVPVTFAMNRVDVTQHLAPEEVVRVIGASDYTQFSRGTLGTFLGLMGYIPGVHDPIEKYSGETATQKEPRKESWPA